VKAIRVDTMDALRVRPRRAAQMTSRIAKWRRRSENWASLMVAAQGGESQAYETYDYVRPITVIRSLGDVPIKAWRPEAANARVLISAIDLVRVWPMAAASLALLNPASQGDRWNDVVKPTAASASSFSTILLGPV
jgi:hypothetical protein